jgi:hypothetical protein
MHERAVACPDRGDGGARRQHRGQPVELVNPVDVPGRGPPAQTAAIYQPELVVDDDEDAPGQLAERRRVGDAGPVGQAALPVQHPVDVVRRWFHGPGEGRRPGRPERVVGGVAAFGAGPVPGGQRDRLVEEEQFGVAAGAHDGSPAAAELQHAHQPAADLVTPDQRQVVVVQHAPVAVHGPAVRGRDQLARGRHPVPQRTVQAREPAAARRPRAFPGHDLSAPPYGRAVWRFPDGIVEWRRAIRGRSKAVTITTHRRGRHHGPGITIPKEKSGVAPQNLKPEAVRRCPQEVVAAYWQEMIKDHPDVLDGSSGNHGRSRRPADGPTAACRTVAHVGVAGRAQPWCPARMARPGSTSRASSARPGRSLPGAAQAGDGCLEGTRCHGSPITMKGKQP